ncbi:transferase family protein [Apodospora peruviana]|uniref:Transferase family protein n=1 Tax=Apodospora peruviana TaxID=516989 RepID=A0AAE0IJB7_9PEZI|nr:transferase family protein [Apodospora peruviana]
MAPAIPLVISQSERVFPESRAYGERVVALSLLDATTADFALTNALWLFEFEHPTTAPEGFNLTRHLQQSFSTVLSAYPQWCGQCKSVTSLDGSTGEEAKGLPPHARRFGRVYAHYDCEDDPGVELITASSPATLETIYPVSRTETLPLWNCQDAGLNVFIPATAIASAMPFQPNDPDGNGLRKPLLAIQITELACSGFVLAAKAAHPMADTTGLVHLLKDWARVSRSMLLHEPATFQSASVFDPDRVDKMAAGDINAEKPDESILSRARSLPMHHFDWWAPADGRPWPSNVPAIFEGQELTPAGLRLPWADWDVAASVLTYIIHLNRQQVDFLWKAATRDQPADVRISKHDAVLAHIWSCVMRARGLGNDTNPVHCDLTLGLRPVLQLGNSFMGSPIILMNAEMTGAEVAREGGISLVARCLRETIIKMSDKAGLAAHLHSVAFEKSPQRIWNAFLGRRHILVTTWARSGIYELDFGFGSVIRYADGIVPNMDGCILIKEAPPSCQKEATSSGGKPAWTDNGVDITVPLRAEDMERLLQDPLLLPKW